AGDPVSQDQAWDAFVQAYSRLLIATARKFGGDRDAAMDRYAYVLEQLRRDDFRRLRGYAADGRSKFTTWLVVVARRLCLDYRRRRYGRPRSEPDRVGAVERVARKRLVDFIAEDLDLSGSISADGPDPEMELRAVQLRDTLSEVLQCLPPRDRLLLAFRYEEELTAREIARLMGLPSVFHVYRRIDTIQRSLREMLEGKGVDGASP
ncbi:MAG: sigma-70 family RNA polymerase sigma factor, partial [Gemmatimonadales bacterium]